MPLVEIIQRELEQSIQVKRRAAEVLGEPLALVARMLIDTLGSGGKLLAMGNGGSAADAQHLVAELVGRYRREREPLRAMALVSNASTVTSIANDYGYEEVFSRQVRAWASPGDVVVGFSTSGRSRNVVRALEAARVMGAKTVAFTGEGGGPCAAVADVLVAVPSTSTARIQETHITLVHALCGLVEHALVEGPGQGQGQEGDS